MKNFLILPILILGSFTCKSQDFDDYMDIKLESEEDYIACEDKVIECASYMLSKPVDSGDKSRMTASAFVFVWMVGAPYTFIIAEWILPLSKKQDGLLLVYLAAIVKYTLENKEMDEADIQLGTANLIYDYCKELRNNVKQKGAIKKFVAAGDAGSLGSYIGN